MRDWLVDDPRAEVGEDVGVGVDVGVHVRLARMSVRDAPIV